MSIWHKRNEFPHGFAEENKLFIYVFDDGIDLTEYCEKYHRCSNLKKWCVFNELLAFEKENKALQEKISELRGIIQRLGDDAEKSQIEKDKLIIENNNLRGLLKDSIYIMNEYKYYFDVKHYNRALEIINKALTKIKENE